MQSNSPDNFRKDIPINGIMRSGECVQSRNLTLGKMGAFYTPNHLEHKALFERRFIPVQGYHIHLLQGFLYEGDRQPPGGVNILAATAHH